MNPADPVELLILPADCGTVDCGTVDPACLPEQHGARPSAGRKRHSDRDPRPSRRDQTESIGQNQTECAINTGHLIFSVI